MHASLHVHRQNASRVDDLAFWKDRLAHEELVPAQRDGQAQILITAADSRFKGIRFREVSFCLLVSLPEDPARSDAAFLLQAYNSSRFFAFCERVFFSTPYDHARVRVETSHPCRISVAQGGEEIFRAAMPGESTAIARAALPVADDGWEGPVFLPRRQAAGARRVFFARINGRTRKYAFPSS